MDEFDFINNIKKKFASRLIGDDCAVLPLDAESDMLVSADLLVEDVDFRLEWTSPRLLGHKALAVSFSDIAAMGGTPAWALLSFAVPERLWNSSFLDEFYEGWHDLAALYEVELAGGDVSRTPGGLVVDSIVGGSVPRGRAVLRSGARLGDSIYLSGPLGGAAAGLKMLDLGERYSPEKTDAGSQMILKQLRPEPQLRLGAVLQAGSIANSMIDLSDGLSSDLSHVCRASGVGAKIFAEEIPFDTALLDFTGSIDGALDLAMNGGEDFELLFTADPQKISEAGVGDIFRIGEITGNAGVIEVVSGGRVERLEPRGYRHF